MPPSVATARAHSGAAAAGRSVLAVLTFMFAWWIQAPPRLFGCLPGFERFRIGHRRGDHVTAARPFSQINQAAALTAEGKSRLRAQHNLAAGGAAEAANSLARHEHLDDADHEIVIVRLGHFAAHELAAFERFTRAEIVDEDFAVDFRRMHRRAALPQQFAL